MRAGPTVMRATIVGRSATPSATSLSARGRPVSSPTTPFAADSNSTSFSSRWWGGVVGRDRVDRAVRERGAERVDVGAVRSGGAILASVP
jgi:hypothetical protein